jgi:hypothetical protein
MVKYKCVEIIIYKNTYNWVLVTHGCNSSYTEGRDQEDHDLRPAQENSS